MPSPEVQLNLSPKQRQAIAAYNQVLITLQDSTPRLGWLRRGLPAGEPIEDPRGDQAAVLNFVEQLSTSEEAKGIESVADHEGVTAVLTIIECLANPKVYGDEMVLDMVRTMLNHDNPEATIKDIPFGWIASAEKHELEDEVAVKIYRNLPDEEGLLRRFRLFNRNNAGGSTHHRLDRLEMFLTSVYLEQKYPERKENLSDLHEYFSAYNFGEFSDIYDYACSLRDGTEVTSQVSDETKLTYSLMQTLIEMKYTPASQRRQKRTRQTTLAGETFHTASLVSILVDVATLQGQPLNRLRALEMALVYNIPIEALRKYKSIEGGNNLLSIRDDYDNLRSPEAIFVGLISERVRQGKGISEKWLKQYLLPLPVGITVSNETSTNI